MKKPLNGEGPFEQGFHGPNLGYVIELYERYLEDPSSIDPEMKDYFERNGSPLASEGKNQLASSANQPMNAGQLEKHLLQFALLIISAHMATWLQIFIRWVTINLKVHYSN